MSAAMDDFGISGVSNALQADYALEQVKPGTSETTSNEKISGSEKSQPEINDVFEKKSSDEKRILEKLQEEYADVEQRKQLLESVDAMLAQTEEKSLSKVEAEVINTILDEIVPQEKQATAAAEDQKAQEKQAREQKIEEEKAVEQKVQEQQAEVQRAEEQKVQEQKAEEQKAENKKAVDETTAAKAMAVGEQQAAKEAQQPVSAEEKEKSTQEVSELRAKVVEKQQEIAKLQKELYYRVSSVVEISIGKGENTEETQEQQAEELKESVSDDIKENPVKSVKMQITKFDENLLLAMLSLRK